MTPLQLIILVVVVLVLVPVLFPVFFQNIKQQTQSALDRTTLDERVKEVFNGATGNDEFTRVRDAFTLIESYLTEQDKPSLSSLRDRVAVSLFSKSK